MIEVKLLQQGACAALYDAQRSAGWVQDWLAGRGDHGTGRRLVGGRGEVAFIAPRGEPWVWRHYRRGGLLARLFKDRYLWRGAARTRCFREFQLLTELAEAGLPVAAPVAARYRRHGLSYQADLVTVQLPAARTLAEVVLAGAFDLGLAADCGVLIARFHRRGIWHADLNAHNILRSAGHLYLIDFDRGRRRPLAWHWQRANLRRLRRSLLKLGGAQGQAASWPALWQSLLDAYRQAVRS